MGNLSLTIAFRSTQNVLRMSNSRKFYLTDLPVLSREYKDFYYPIFTGEDKNGTCPFLAPPQLCVSDVDECFIDWDCVGNRKCCSNRCFKICASPSVGAGGLGIGNLQTAAAGIHSLHISSRFGQLEQKYSVKWSNCLEKQ